MSATLFDVFGVEANFAKSGIVDDPAPLKYRAVRSKPPRVSNETWEPYRVSAIDIEGARTHGTPLVESSILASVKGAFPTYRPKLPPSLVSRGVLSAEQLENVVYAGDQHQHTFPLVTIMRDEDGKLIAEEQEVRRGFFIGDGTGAGKGRTVAGIIADNRNHGRTRTVWLSQSQILIHDAVRDWTEIGGDARDIVAWNATKIDATLAFRDGILFGTYALLRSRKTTSATSTDPQTGERTMTSTTVRRVRQLVEALGRTFDGVIVLDECHNAANADPLAEENVKASQQGRAVLELQHELPFARLVYVSATGASRVDALSYAPRLGLWAKNGAFASRENFLSEMADAGTSALEMITRDLKALGRMSSRSLSYEGLTYQRLEYELDDDEVALYNGYNEMWRSIESGFKAEFVRLGGARRLPDGQVVVYSNRAIAQSTSLFQARRQQFYAHVLLQFKMPKILAFAQKKLDAGRSIIMQLTHTNEASANRAIAKMAETDSLDDVDLTQRDLMLDYVRAYYPIHRFEVIEKTSEGRTRAAHMLGDDGQPIVDVAARDRRDALLMKLETLLVVRDGPLEMIYDAFGEHVVAEVTGRARKIVLRDDVASGARRRVIVPRGSKENERETEAFVNGPKRVLVFSEQAGGTGRSYHADIRFANHQPRTHIMLEMSWRAESAVQCLGRSHRSNQVCPPELILPTTNVPGEKRFASTPARKIAALGALSRGDRSAAANGLFRPEDNLETEYALNALRSLVADMRSNTIPGLGVDVLNDQLGLPYVETVVSPDAPLGVVLDASSVTITRFLNRLLCCDIGPGNVQERIMNAFMERIETEIQNAISAGTYDLGVQQIRARSIVVQKREVIARDPLSRATTELLTIAAEKLPNTLSYESAVAKLDYYRENRPGQTANVGFFVTKQRIELRVPSYAAIDAAGRPMIRVYGQLETDQTTPAIGELKSGTLVSDEDARAPWNAAVGAVPGTLRKINAIVGAITPIWDKLPWTHPEICRMTADDGERIIARILTEPELEQTLATLGQSGPVV